MHLHNHEVSEYKAGVYQLKAKCKTLAKQTQSPSLRSIFDDATRNEPNTHDVSFPECESAMYRSRKTYQPKVPSTATELIDMLGAKFDSDMCRTYKNQFGHVQNLQNSIRTCAELTKFDSDMCRTYKNQFGHVQNLQKSIRTCAELTKINSDMCRTYKIRFGHVQLPHIYYPIILPV